MEAVMATSHEDINRAIGRIEGNQDGFRERMDRFEHMLSDGFHKVGAALEKIEDRLKQIENKEQQRGGAWKVICAIAAAVSGAIALIVSTVIKHLIN
jgi:hypothetical protein